MWDLMRGTSTQKDFTEGKEDVPANCRCSAQSVSPDGATSDIDLCAAPVSTMTSRKLGFSFLSQISFVFCLLVKLLRHLLGRAFIVLNCNVLFFLLQWCFEIVYSSLAVILKALLINSRVANVLVVSVLFYIFCSTESLI